MAEEAQLASTEAADEALVMGLRVREGVDVSAIAERFELLEIVDWRRVDRLVASGHLGRDGTRLQLTASGRLVLDYILGQIALSEPRALAVA
jgi:oxygen-independent coproporphyrinogen-3 oxidase